MEPNLKDIFMVLHQKLGDSLRREAKSLDCTISQLEVLRFVVVERHPTMKDIAEHLRITAPSATALVEHLYARKLVMRKANPKDRRGVRVHPTNKSLRLFSRFTNIKTTAFNEMLSPLSIIDREQLTIILRKLI